MTDAFPLVLDLDHEVAGVYRTVDPPRANHASGWTASLARLPGALASAEGGQGDGGA